MARPAPTFQSWLDDFFAAYYRRRPVNATFIGVHAYDNRLPDFSESGCGDMLAEITSLRRQLAQIPPAGLNQAETTDRLLADGFLEIQEWELNSQHFQQGNPSLYTGEAAFGIISLLRRPFAPAEERITAVAERMTQLPALFEQAQANIKMAPGAWTERAITETTGILALLESGLDLFLQANHLPDRPWDAVKEQAVKAVGDFQHYLATELRQRPTEHYDCGAEAFDRLLKRGYFLDQDAATIAEFACEQMAVNTAYLEEHARDFGAQHWSEALAQLTTLYPSVDHYYARYAELWTACRATTDEHHVLTWPDYPVEYMPRPLWSREAAAQLYFLFYHSPAPFDHLPSVEYLVTPIEPTLSQDEQIRLLRANNDSVIKLNHVVHHGALGHHIQNWHAFRASSRIGQVAVVDCASRIAMFCGGTMTEGWACYATDLMDEIGFLTPLEQYSQYHGRLRMAARAVVDVELHHGRMSLDQATDFYCEQVGMTAGAARTEAVKNSMFPGTGLMYLMGTESIHQLRRDLATRPGFDLRAFHDRFLSYGSIPVALIAQAMRKEFLNA
ncbi:MAG: DUF885 domain-containing protein [Herpetosiphonaceae bacterium]|nr:DUF885 domain-containing protein [Herpetosiphonaceae bacterium]